MRNQLSEFLRWPRLSDKWLEIEIGCWRRDPGNYYQGLIERRCQDTTFTQIGCQIASLCLICRVLWVIPRLGLDNSRNLTTTKRRGERESCWRGLRIKCLLKGEDQYRLGARKTLNLRFGTCIIRGQGQVKGWLWQGRVPETLTWEQRMWTMSNGDRVSVSGGQDGSKWGQSVTTETLGVIS